MTLLIFGRFAILLIHFKDASVHFLMFLFSCDVILNPEIPVDLFPEQNVLPYDAQEHVFSTNWFQFCLV